MTLNDRILSVETQLLFDRTIGLEPKDGDLTVWKGVARSPVGPIPFEISIPSCFPNCPPVVTLLTRVNHPRVDSSGHVQLRILSRWRPTNHVYQAVNELLRTLEELVVPISAPAPEVISSSLPALREQVTTLRAKLNDRKAELQRLKSTKVHQISDDMIERSKTDLENELWEIDTQFERAEIDAKEYARRYVDVRKRLELLILATS